MRFPSSSAVLAASLSLAATSQLVQAADSEAASDVLSLTKDSFASTVDPEVSQSHSRWLFPLSIYLSNPLQFCSFNRLLTANLLSLSTLSLSSLPHSSLLSCSVSHASRILRSMVWSLSSLGSSRKSFPLSGLSVESNFLLLFDVSFLLSLPTLSPLDSTKKPLQSSRTNLSN